MQKETLFNMEDDLRSEYNLAELLKDGVRGKYADRYKKGTELSPFWAEKGKEPCYVNLTQWVLSGYNGGREGLDGCTRQ
jgi:hypothetical protein